MTRLTVYRHFPDLESLFDACSQRWKSQHPAPDPSQWLDVPDPDDRARPDPALQGLDDAEAADVAALFLSAVRRPAEKVGASARRADRG